MKASDDEKVPLLNLKAFRVVLLDVIIESGAISGDASPFVEGNNDAPKIETPLFLHSNSICFR